MKTNVNRKISVVIISVFILSVASVGMKEVVGAGSAPCVTVYGGGSLSCPVNTTYTTNQLTLQMDFGNGLGMHCVLTYDIDGVYSGPIPLTYTNPQEMHVVMQTTGTAQLPTLSDGSHCLTITVAAKIEVWPPNKPGAPFKATGINETDYEAIWKTPVYFTIDTKQLVPAKDSAPPTVTQLSIEQNATYYSKEIPLVFTSNENISQATYSLDGQSNVTLTGNTTLTGLASGNHNLVVFVWDDAGNVGFSQTNFLMTNHTLEAATSKQGFPTVLAVALAVASVVAVLAAAVYVKKRGRKVEASVVGNQN